MTEISDETMSSQELDDLKIQVEQLRGVVAEKEAVIKELDESNDNLLSSLKCTSDVIKKRDEAYYKLLNSVGDILKNSTTPTIIQASDCDMKTLAELLKPKDNKDETR
jgi:hypothetical protein